MGLAPLPPAIDRKRWAMGSVPAKRLQRLDAAGGDGGSAGGVPQSVRKKVKGGALSRRPHCLKRFP